MLKKNRYKPIYKKILKLKIITPQSFKILKLKKNKWNFFLFFLKRSMSKTKFKQFKILDQSVTLLNRKNKFELNYKQNYKKKFVYFKILNLFFGQLKTKYFKNLKVKIKKVLKTKLIKNPYILLIKKLQNRLDFILWQSKFCLSLKTARQLIFHGKVKVNKKIVINKTFHLTAGDLISLNLKKLRNLNYKYLSFSTWPLYPNFLVINYKTMQIIFLSNTISNLLSYSLNLNFKKAI